MAKHRIAADGSWRYSGAIDRFPVAVGDVWRADVDGLPHIFACGDLEGITPLHALLGKYGPQLMYVDPPFNAGVARTYRTKAGVESRRVDIVDLWTAVLSPASQYRLLAYVETGQAQREALHLLAGEMGGAVTGDWDITYYRTKPAALVAVDFRPVPSTDHPDFTGMDDEHTPLAALEWHGQGRVVDPCAGRGLTARAAAQAGWASISHELSPYRLAEALESFKQMTGVTPTKQEGSHSG